MARSITLDTERPETVHGRLLEGVHLTGYTADRAYTALDWLLTDDRWREVGDGYDDINVFLGTLDLSEFKLGIERRKSLVRKIAALEASQRQTAKALGVGVATVNRDLSVPGGTVADEVMRDSTDAGVPDGTPRNGRLMSVHYSTETDDWATPQDLFDALDAEFRFDLDVCAAAENAKCSSYFTAEQDGLAQSWLGADCWMNPPYGSEIGAWVEKAHRTAEEGGRIVCCLLPARTDTGWWWGHCRYAEIRFLRGRLRFGGGENGAPFPSAVVIFGRRAKVVWWDR